MKQLKHVTLPHGNTVLDHARVRDSVERAAITSPYAVPRLLLADPHRVVRECLKALLPSHTRVEIIAEASDGYSALALCRSMTPDVLVMDLNLPALNGLELIRMVRRCNAPVRILVFSGEVSEQQAAAALDAGAHGYVLKQSAIDSFKEAVLDVLRGRQYLDPHLSVDEIFACRQDAGFGGRKDLRNHLTRRERQILKLIAEGARNREIAEKLTVSQKTVETHRTNMMHKLQAHNAAELSQWARRLGLLVT